MNPEEIAHELEIINNRDMSEQTAHMFMTELNKQLRLYPQLKNNPLILKQIERFEYDLGLLELDWAQEQLAALQKFKSERGMLAGEVDENSTVAGKKEVQNENEAPRAGSKSLETLDSNIDSFNVLTLAKTTLLAEGYEYTVAGVKKYQEAHNIGIDGVIGKETYLEMKAGVVITDLSKELEKEEKIISSDIQKEIEFIWKYGTKDGTNISALFAQLIAYQGDKSIYNKNKVFLDKMLGEYKDYTQSNEGTKAAKSAEAKLKSETQGNGKTVWENIKEGNIEEIIKNPTLLMTAGLLFLFGVVGGDTKYTDSVFKRIGWIIGGLFMGPKLYHEIIGPAITDGKEFLRSPEAETAVATGRDKAGNIFKDAIDWAGKTWDEVSTTVMGEYDAFTKSMESKNETFKNSPDAAEKAKYIDKISEKQSLIFSDEKFLNTPISTFLTLEHSDAGLASVLSPETFAKLGLSGNDAKNFIEIYILPKIEEAQKAGGTVEKWSDVYLPAHIRETAQTISEDIVTWMALPFVASASLDMEIKTELSTLMNTGTSAQKDAAKNLAYRLSLGKYTDFKVENFPELSGSEQDIFNQLLAKIGNILIQEKVLKNYETKIQNEVSLSGISIITAPILEERWTKLQAIKNDYTAKRDSIVAVGVTTETLDIAFAGKERELLEAALNNGIVTLDEKNVIDELQQVDTKEAVANGVNIMQEYLANLEELPPVTATPLELKAWYERNREAFDEASKIGTAGNLPAGSNEALIADAAKKIMERKERFITIYEAKKTEYVGKFLALETLITIFNTENITEQNFDTKQKELAGFSNTYSQYMSEIEASWIKDVSSKITGKISDWWNGTYSFDSSSSAFMIDGIESEKPNPDITLVETSLKTKAEELKKKFDAISEAKIGDISIVSMKPALDPIIANIRTKLEVSDPERYEIFKNTIQDPSVTKVSDLLKVFDTLIETIELELSLTQDQGAKDVLQNQILLFRQAKEEIVGKIKGSLSQDAIAWIQQLYGSVDDYYQTLIQ